MSGTRNLIRVEEIVRILEESLKQSAAKVNLGHNVVEVGDLIELHTLEALKMSPNLEDYFAFLFSVFMQICVLLGVCSPTDMC